MLCIGLFENGTEETTTCFRVRLEVHYYVITRLQELRGERPYHGFQLLREVNVVVKGLHLIAEQPHHPYVFGYQYCCVVPRETGGNCRLSSAGFAAEEVK